MGGTRERVPKVVGWGKLCHAEESHVCGPNGSEAEAIRGGGSVSVPGVGRALGERET